MLSIRSIVRSLPRVLSRPAAQSSKLNFTALHRALPLQSSWRISSRPACAAFSTSASRFQTQEGSVDGELSAKLESELQLEQEMSEVDDMPANLKDFLDSSSFELHDTPGEEEVVLTKSFGNEKIRVSFTIADLDTIDQDADQYGEDKAMYDEEDTESNMQQGGAQSKGTVSQGQTRGGNINVAHEDRVVPADRPELMDDESPAEDQEPSFPARVNITIEKSGVKGAIQIESVAQDGMVAIENVYFFPKAELADAKTAEHDWSRRLMYTGPPFANLDDDLQVLLERYLEERGINTALALWIPEYIDFKEQSEYLRWLSEVKNFVDA